MYKYYHHTIFMTLFWITIYKLNQLRFGWGNVSIISADKGHICSIIRIHWWAKEQCDSLGVY